MVKAGVYVRVSTEEQAKKGVSLAAQEEALMNYCKTFKYDLHKIYKDEGISAKDLKHRPAMNELLEDAKSKKIDLILIYKLDRFSRSLKDLILTIEQLNKWGVDFISMQEKIDTTSATGEFMFHIIGSLAQFERRIIGERTKFGMEKKAKDGFAITRAPLGYILEDKKLLVNNSDKKKVLDIFNSFLGWKESLNKFAKHHGFTTRGIAKLLKNQIYLGKIKFAGEWYGGEHSAIIDESVFEAVQRKLKQHSRRKLLDLIEEVFVQGDNRYYDNNASLLLANFIRSKVIIINKYPALKIKSIPENELKLIPPPQKELKYVATKILEKNDAEILFFERFFRGRKVDIMAKYNGKKIAVECGSCDINKAIEYLEAEDTELWIVTKNSLFKVLRGPKWNLAGEYRRLEQKEVDEAYEKALSKRKI